MQVDNSELNFTEIKAGEIVFIAGGKFGPIKKLITEALKSEVDEKIRLFYGANSQGDLNGYKKFRDLSEFSNNFNMVTALNSSHPEWEGEVGLITDVVRDHLNPERVSKCFVYGTNVMVKETRKTLKDLGIQEDKIQAESYERTY